MPTVETEKIATAESALRRGKVLTNFLIHYYDIHQLLDVEAVQKFIGTPEYLEHKEKRFKSLNLNVAESGAFAIEDQTIRRGIFEDGSALLSRPNFAWEDPYADTEGPWTSVPTPDLKRP